MKWTKWETDSIKFTMPNTTKIKSQSVTQNLLSTTWCKTAVSPGLIINGYEQDCCITLGIVQSCTKPLICLLHLQVIYSTASWLFPNWVYRACLFMMWLCWWAWLPAHTGCCLLSCRGTSIQLHIWWGPLPNEEASAPLGSLNLLQMREWAQHQQK